MESVVSPVDREKMFKLLNSSFFVDKLMSMVPVEQRDELRSLLPVYQQEGRVPPPEFESVCLRLNSLNTQIQFHQLSRLLAKITVGRLFIRFALVDPRGLSAEQCQVFAGLTDQGLFTGRMAIFYQDEWLAEVGQGHQIGLSGLAPESQPSDKTGAYQAHMQQFNTQLSQLISQQRSLIEHFNSLPSLNLEQLKSGEVPSRLLTGEQKESTASLLHLLQQLVEVDKRYRSVYEQQQRLSLLLAEKGLSSNGSQQGERIVRTEIKQLQRLRRSLEGEDSLPRPCLQASRLQLDHLASRQRTTALLEKFERLDPGLFVRRFRNHFYRFAPRVLLLPVHGDRGLCWQAFDKKERGKSHCLLVVPMYTSDPEQALLTALAELRWMTAKQMAANYWLSEGLTGHYSSWLHKNRSKNGEQEHFVRDYCLWLQFESQGRQRLHSALRQIFWQWLPWPAKLSEQLSARHPVYADLHRRSPPGKKPGEVKLSSAIDL